MMRSLVASPVQAGFLAACLAMALVLGSCSRTDTVAPESSTDMQEQIAAEVARQVAEQLAASQTSPTEASSLEETGQLNPEAESQTPPETAPVWKVGSPGPNGGLVYYVHFDEFYEALAPGHTIGLNENLPSGWVTPDMEDLGLIYEGLQKTGVADYGNVYYISVSKSGGKNRFLRMSDNKEAVGLSAGRRLGVRIFDPSQPPAELAATALVYTPKAAEISAASSTSTAASSAASSSQAASSGSSTSAADKAAAERKAAADKAAADKAAAERKAAADKLAAEQAAAAAAAAAKYHIGDTGPAGGIVFYDKGNESGGWRYMEAAPSDLSGVYGLSDQYLIETTKESIGSGKANTQIIADLCRKAGQTDALPVRIQALTIGGYNDWFMPSHLELVQVYKNLAAKGLGGTFQETFYHSSSEQLYNGLGYVHCINFANGERWGYHKTNGRPTRPIRSFL
ncbi:hypothetical protein FACS189468_3350 [Spirochaetia bacterium]|nr:hypothetical protein FACS189468_3350 [Spirochaetia bacterium]